MIERPKVPQNINNLSFSKSLIPVLAIHLNKLHGINESNHYWEFLILPHIQLMSERIVDRLVRIQDGDLFEYITVKKITTDSEMTHDPLFWFSQKPENELFILTKIMKFLEKSSIDFNQTIFKKNETLNDSNKSLSNFYSLLAFKQILRNFIEKCVKSPLEHIYKEIKIRQFYRTKNSKVFILRDFLDGETERNLKNKMQFIKSSNLQFYLERKSSEVLSLEMRKTFTNFRSEHINLSAHLTSVPELNLYTKFLEKNLLSLLPSFCVEEYNYFRSYLKNIRSDFIISDSIVFWDAVSRHIFADQKSKGSKSLVFQHGGGFDIERYNSFEIMEREFSDKFISWRDSKHIPGLISRTSLIKANHQYAKKIFSPSVDVLIIGTMFKDFHVYNVGHHPVFNTLITKRVKNLIKVLNENGFLTKYRPYGWREDEISMAEGIRLGRVASIYEEILQAKLVICCKPTTTVNDCLAVGRYPLLFFGEEQTNVTFARESLEALKKEKFYFDDPKECVEYVSSLVDDLSITPSNATKKIFHNLFGERIATSDDMLRIIQEFTNSN
jgi:putative transferase (TIGR04331 family)